MKVSKHTINGKIQTQNNCVDVVITDTQSIWITVSGDLVIKQYKKNKIIIVIPKIKDEN